MSSHVIRIQGLFVGILFVMVSGMAQAQVTHRVPGDHGTIQEAIDASVNGDTVLVAPGTYYENIDFRGREIQLASEAGPLETIIDGSRPADEKVGTVVRLTNVQTDQTVLRGFTIQGGTGSWTSFLGGFRNSGGIKCYSGSPVIEGCIICDNTCNNGGGIEIVSASPIIIGNLICRNKALRNPENPDFMPTGGGIFASEWASPLFLNNTIVDNECPDGGGGIGIVYLRSSECRIVNNIITGNHGGGVESFEPSQGIVPQIIACNIWNNPNPYQGEVPCEQDCISEDPLFVDAAFRLSPGSPCVDSGREDPRLPALDLYGSPRVCSSAPDMGAAEVCESPAPRFQRGDTNSDDSTDLSDAVATLSYLFLGDKTLTCEQAGDANDDGTLDISDAVYILSYLFVGGEAIEPPVKSCGEDPTGHGLPCESFPACE